MKLDIPHICRVLGWFLLGALLMSGGAMSLFILTEHEAWSKSEVRHYVPLGHAHAGVLAIVMLVVGLYLERTSLSRRAQTTAGILYISGALTIPGGFLGVALMPEQKLLLLAVPLGGVMVFIAFLMIAFGMIRRTQSQASEGDS